MIPDHPFDDYRGRRILVMGLGAFGGGLGAVKFLVDRGAVVTVTDLRSPETLADSLAALHESPPARLVLGRHDEDDFRNSDLIVVNPAVKRNNSYLDIARSAGVPITSEMNLFWKWNRAPVVAVTGSNGKSTTTAMTHAILERTLSNQPGRRAWLGGNIGKSLLPDVDQIQPDDLVVLELSSFQLADLGRLHVSPRVAVVTNFAPNHLDWHPDLNDYRESKQAILRWQLHSDVAVLNDDDTDVSHWPAAGRRLGFGLHDTGEEGAFWTGQSAVLRFNGQERDFPLADCLSLPGQHNVANALAATAAAMSLGADVESVQFALKHYQPLPHRLQFVGTVDGIAFYNDSLATTPESAVVALAAFEQPIVLLAGGYDKHVDLSGMAHAIAGRVKAVSLMGQTARSLKAMITSCENLGCCVSEPQPTFASAFAWALEQSKPGDVVLLSPGCASYDWFRNFADRGEQFAQLVLQLINSKKFDE